jgi:hypothetical protein
MISVSRQANSKASRSRQNVVWYGYLHLLLSSNRVFPRYQARTIILHMDSNIFTIQTHITTGAVSTVA